MFFLLFLRPSISTRGILKDSDNSLRKRKLRESNRFQVGTLRIIISYVIYILFIFILI